MTPILAAVADEMARQREIHPIRPRHPYHWHTVLGEEVFEALLEVSRLTQDFAGGATVDTRLDAAKRLRTELVQVAAVASAWAETLPASAAGAPRHDQAPTRPEVATATDRAPGRRRDLIAHDRSQRAEIERLREELYRLKEQSTLGAAGATRNRISLEAEVQMWKDNHGLVVSDRDAWRARAAKAEAELLDIAHAIGIVHEPDTGPCYPGPIEEIVKAIRDAKHGAQEGRARADRYLAAMRSLMEGPLNQNRFAGWDAIRALVEEVKRG